jgi:hypothetical protein
LEKVPSEESAATTNCPGKELTIFLVVSWAVKPPFQLEIALLEVTYQARSFPADKTLMILWLLQSWTAFWR